MLTASDWREDGMKDFLVSGSSGRLVAFWLCCCQACFAYLGSEIIGITANEVERPRQTLPKAVRRVSKRLVFYYVGTLFVLGLNLSSDDQELGWYISNPAGSYQGPFVLMVQRANIPILPSLLNAIALVAAISLANANLYVTVHLISGMTDHQSRTLYALSTYQQAPKVFQIVNKYNVPWVALAVSALPTGLAYLSLRATSNDVRLNTFAVLIELLGV